MCCVVLCCVVLCCVVLCCVVLCCVVLCCVELSCVVPLEHTRQGPYLVVTKKLYDQVLEYSVDNL